MTEKEICLVCNNELPEDATECPVCKFPVVSVLHGTDEEKQRLKEMADEYRKEHWHPLEDEKKKQQDAEYLEMQRKLNEEQQQRIKLEEELQKLKEELQREENGQQKQETEEERNPDEELENNQEQIDFWKKELNECYGENNVLFAPDIPKDILEKAVKFKKDNSIKAEDVFAVGVLFGSNASSVSFVLTKRNRIIFDKFDELAENITDVKCTKVGKIIYTSNGVEHKLKVDRNYCRKLAVLLKNAAEKYGKNVSSDIMTEEEYKKAKDSADSKAAFTFCIGVILAFVFFNSGIVPGAVISGLIALIALFSYGN